MRRSRKRRIFSGFLLAVVILSVIVCAGYYLHKMYLRAQYPRQFSEQVTVSSQEFQLDPHFIYALIKAESAFDPEAVSHSGAIGLMQLMPTTAEEVADKLDIKDFQTDNLYQPQINVRLGCKYLATLLARYDNKECALAAYNAGSTKVNAWLSDSRYSRDGQTLYYIPYAETRGYVKKVMEAYEMYNQIYDEND